MTELMQHPIRLGLIGAGAACINLHLPELAKRKDFSITHVLSRSESSARRVVEICPDVRLVGNLEQLLAQPGLDAIVIMVPIHLSHSVTSVALRTPLHVLVEKPLGRSTVEADQLLELAKRRPQVSMVAESMLYDPMIQKAHSLLNLGAVGTPRFVVCESLRHVSIDQQASWREENLHGGGYFLDGGVHFVAVLQYLFGRIHVDRAIGSTFHAHLGSPDSVSVHFLTDRGVAGVLSFARTDQVAAKNSTRLVCVGSEGSLEIQAGRIVRSRRGESEVVYSLENTSAYAAEYDDFRNAIVHGSPVLSTFDRGRDDLAVIERILELLNGSS